MRPGNAILGLPRQYRWRPRHHGDHTGGNLELKNKYSCTIVGSRADQARIPGIDITLGDGDAYDLGSARAQVFDVIGHTQSHIMYWFEDSKALFVGDTLFAMGCGRLSEGTPAQMWAALTKFGALPDRTRVYCAREYTQAYARFALTIEPGTPALRARAKEVDGMRGENIATVLPLLGAERATNPFLRAGEPELMAVMGMAGAAPVDVLAETRRRKDNFR